MKLNLSPKENTNVVLRCYSSGCCSGITWAHLSYTSISVIRETPRTTIALCTCTVSACSLHAFSSNWRTRNAETLTHRSFTCIRLLKDTSTSSGYNIFCDVTMCSTAQVEDGVATETRNQLLDSCLFHLFRLPSDLEDRSSILLQNASELPLDYTASQRQNLKATKQQACWQTMDCKQVEQSRHSLT
jgi:hypothetical protein